MTRPRPPLLRALPLALLLLARAHAAAAVETSRTDAVRAGRTAPRFTVVEAVPDPDAAAQVARILPSALERTERWGRLSGPVVVTIHPSGTTLAAAVGHPGRDWLRGWARPGAIDVVSPRGWSRGKASDGAVTTLLAHELTHCLLFQRLGARWARRDVPAWFEEGMASFTAGERHAGADSVPTHPPAPPSVPSGATGPPPAPAVAYATADRAFRDLVARHGEPAVQAILDGLGAGLPFERALRTATATR